MPHNIQGKIDTTVVYKNLNTTATFFFNYKNTVNHTNHNPTNTFKCLCHLNKFSNFLNIHGHIDTNNTNILTEMEKHLKLPSTNIKDLADKGANYIVQPFINSNIIQKHFTKDITKFIDKISTQFKLPTYIFQEWKLYVIKQISHITNTINTTNSSYNITQIKNSLIHIHKHLTCAPTDKLKNNYRFTCNTYTQRLISLKITSQPTLILNSNIYPNAKIESTNKHAYEAINTPINEIIKEHNTFLTNIN